PIQMVKQPSGRTLLAGLRQREGADLACSGHRVGGQDRQRTAWRTFLVDRSTACPLNARFTHDLDTQSVRYERLGPWHDQQSISCSTRSANIRQPAAPRRVGTPSERKN